MTKEDIYNSLIPSWWVSQTNGFNTEFMSTEIVFDTSGLNNCTYVSSSPYQTNGLNSGTGAYTNDLPDFVNNLRTEASQRLFDMHCTSIVGHNNLSSVYNATD